VSPRGYCDFVDATDDAPVTLCSPFIAIYGDACAGKNLCCGSDAIRDIMDRVKWRKGSERCKWTSR
jgi:hypothetical protein